ncbi:MAG: sugar ABC transporter permease [Thermomicrobiales bacterium]|nr:sugar ABC transporter permease [Thermomicrobiales bacterium]MCO5221114.1 sugar ABC transporter permease [Thermomicrobiales bacterium]
MELSRGVDSDIQDSLKSYPAAPANKRSRWFSQFDGRDKWIALLMIGIPTLLHVALVWFPTVSSILLSFTNWNGIRFSSMEWVGLKNYQQIFGAFQRNTYQALLNNTVLMLFLFAGPTALGILLAYLLDKNIRGTRIYQAVFFTPVVLSLAVVGFIWKSVIYSTDNGLATQLFGGGKSVDWLGNQSFLIPIGDYGISHNFAAILVAIAWRHTGYIMVLYLAGLKAVDPSLREAALLDGSSEWQTFKNVIFPSLKPVNVVIVVITVIEALRAFDIIYVLNTPRKTEVLSILTTNNLLGEGGGNVGRGSAYATILFILCFGFVIWYVTNHYRNTQEGADS